MKKTLIFALTFFGVINSLIAQEPDPELLDQQWLLQYIRIGTTAYQCTDYGYYPDLYFEEEFGEYKMFIDSTGGMGCIISISSFVDSPPRFELIELGACLAKPPCDDLPNGPCTTIHGIHFDFYNDHFNEFIEYEISDNGDGTMDLIITLLNGDQAIYGNYNLSTQSFNANSIAIFPSPTSNLLTITSEGIDITNMEIYNVLGEKIMEVGNNSIINVAGLSEGIYFLRIHSKKGSALKKFIKK